MISTLCDASILLGDDACLTAAQRCADFIQDNLTRKDGSLYLRWSDGEAKYEGHIDDYAFFAHAQLALYRATAEPRHLKRAVALTDAMLGKLLRRSGRRVLPVFAPGGTADTAAQTQR